MLTAAQAAERLGLSVRAVYDIPDADLPRYRMGAGRGAVRFAPSDLDAYLARCRSTTTKPASAGGTSSRVSLKDADSELQSYFRRHGLPVRQKPTARPKTPSSTPLRLVQRENNP